MRHAAHLALAAALVAGCAVERPAPVAAGAAPAPRLVATFSGEADAVSGTLRLTALAPSSGQALTEQDVVQDGQPGIGPDDTVELVTESAATVPGGCGVLDSFEGTIRLRSFHVSACLRNAYAEIVSLAPTGYEACNSAPAVPGVSSAMGLFAYGDLARAGVPGDSATALWRFRLPSATRFSFKGRIMADVVAACGAPGLPGVPAVALPAAGAGVAVGDLTLDGRPDLATVSGASGAAELLVAAGGGGGRFAAPLPAALGPGYAAPVRTALADVRGSPALDVLHTDASGALVVHENLGTGAFAAARAYPVAAAGGRIALATSNLDAFVAGDVDTDVVVAGAGVTAFLNAGGTLTAVTAAGATSSGRAVRIADVDADSRPDVLTVDGASLVLVPQTTNPPTFGFRVPVVTAVPTAGADLWDVAVVPSGAATLVYAANRGNGCLARFRGNNPVKAFVYEACLALPFAPERMAAADLDGNGSVDLAAAGHGAVAVLLADAAQPGGFRVATHGGVAEPTALVARDLDGDGDTDLATSSATARAHAVLLNAGGGAFLAPSRVPAGAGAEVVAAVLLDGDGATDLVVASRGASAVTPLLAAGAGAFAAGAAISLPSAPVALAAGRLDGDAFQDVAVAVAGGEVCVLLGDGAGALGAPTCASVGAAPAGLALLDVTGDGALDAAVTLGDAAGTVRVLANGGAGVLALAPGLDATAAPWAAGAVAADLTGDGVDDLAVAGDALAVLPGTGARLGAAIATAIGPGARALALGDLDGDGLLDAAATGAGEVQLLLGTGAGGFDPGPSLPFAAPAAVAIADLSGDGLPDVAATSSSHGLVGVALARGPGAFDAFVPWPAGAVGAGLVAADLDGDLRADLAAADPAGGAVDVLRAIWAP